MRRLGELTRACAAVLVVLAAVGCGPSTTSSAVDATGGAGGGATAGSGGAGAGGADAGVDAPGLAPDASGEDAPSEHAVDSPGEQVVDAPAESRDAPASNGDGADDGDAGSDAAVMHPRYLDSVTVDENLFATWVAFGADGSAYLAGSYDEYTDFDPTVPATDYRNVMGGLDLFLTKLNPDGSRAWTKTIGGPSSAAVFANAITVTSDAIFLTGQFVGTIDFDPGAGTASRTGTNTTAYVLRLTTDGAFGWVGVILNANAGDNCSMNHALVAGSDGSLYATLSIGGTCDIDPGPATNQQSSTGFSKGMLLKLSQTDGHLIWSQTPQGATCQSGVDAVTIALDGNVWIGVTADAGCALGTAETGTTSGTIYASITPAGTVHGAWLLSGNVDPTALAAATDGAVYASGSFTDTVDFDPGPGVANQTPTPSGGGFVLKLAADGSYRWVHTMSGRASYVVAATPNGGAIALGESQGLIGFHVDAFAADSTPEWTFPLMAQGVSGVTIATAPTRFAVTGNDDNLLDLDPGPDIHNAIGGSSFTAFYAY